jgi:hypothetical protein
MIEKKWTPLKEFDHLRPDSDLPLGTLLFLPANEDALVKSYTEQYTVLEIGGQYYRIPSAYVLKYFSLFRASYTFRKRRENHDKYRLSLEAPK